MAGRDICLASNSLKLEIGILRCVRGTKSLDWRLRQQEATSASWNNNRTKNKTPLVCLGDQNKKFEAEVEI